MIPVRAHPLGGVCDGQPALGEKRLQETRNGPVIADEPGAGGGIESIEVTDGIEGIQWRAPWSRESAGRFLLCLIK